VLKFINFLTVGGRAWNMDKGAAKTLTREKI
jgi:hypothetical protein